MPPPARMQRTEYLPVPTAYQAPIGIAHHDWPIVATYASMAWAAREADSDA